MMIFVELLSCPFIPAEISKKYSININLIYLNELNYIEIMEFLFKIQTESWNYKESN